MSDLTTGAHEIIACVKELRAENAALKAEPRNNGPCFCLSGLDTIARLRVRQALAILHRAASITVTSAAKDGAP